MNEVMHDKSTTETPFLQFGDVIVKDFHSPSPRQYADINVYNSPYLRRFEVKISDDEQPMLTILAEVFADPTPKSKYPRPETERVMIYHQPVISLTDVPMMVYNAMCEYLGNHKLARVGRGFDLTKAMKEFAESHDPTIQPSDIPNTA